jgi:hypothetical protein
MMYLKYLKKGNRKEMYAISEGIYKGNDNRTLNMLAKYKSKLEFNAIKWKVVVVSLWMQDNSL